MATEQEPATTTTTETAQTSTQPPVQGATTATAEPETLAGVPKADHRAQVLARLAAKNSALTSTQPPPKVEQTQSEPAKEGETTTTEPEKGTEEAKPEDEAAKTSTEEAKEQDKEPEKNEEDDAKLEAARRLKELAEASRRMREQRARETQAAKARQAAVEAKEAEIARREKEIAERDRVRQEAIASGSKLAILRAAGIPDKELIHGNFLFEAMQEAGEADENPQPQAQSAQKLTNPVLTAEQVAEIVRKDREESEKLRLQTLQQQEQAAFAQRQQTFFAQVEEEYAKGAYEALKALPESVRPTLKMMDERLTAIWESTHQGLTPAELLQLYDDEIKASGIVIPKPKATKPAAPAAKPAPSAVKTTTQQAIQASEDARGEKEPPPKRERSMHALREEGWEETARRLAERRAARGG